MPEEDYRAEAFFCYKLLLKSCITANMASGCVIICHISGNFSAL